MSRTFQAIFKKDLKYRWTYWVQSEHRRLKNWGGKKDFNKYLMNT